jgi:cytoskeleton protein RodZ
MTVLDVGMTLRDARVRLGLDVDECERRTRIRAGQLRALEEGRFDKLPEPAYTRGFVRAYARELGLDAERLVAEYDRLVGHEGRLDEHALQPLPPPEGRIEALRANLRPPRRPGRTATLRLLTAAGIIVLGVLAWTGVSGSRSPAPPSRPSGAAAPPAPKPVAAAPASPSRPRRPELVVAGLAPRGSYLEVRRGDAGGPLVFEGMVPPGAARRFALASPVWMRVGWTPSLRARVAGHPVTLTGGTANFRVTRAGARPAQV